MCEIIARAADQPEKADAVHRFKTGFQFRLIYAIMEQTFESEDDVKNFIGMLGNAPENIRAFMERFSMPMRPQEDSPTTEALPKSSKGSGKR